MVRKYKDSTPQVSPPSLDSILLMQTLTSSFHHFTETVQVLRQNCGGEDRWYRHLSSLRGISTSKFVLSPAWCSRPRPTTGVLLAPCHDEFRGPRSDYVRQVETSVSVVHEMIDTLVEEAPGLVVELILNRGLDLIIVDELPSLQNFLKWTEYVVVA
ncbi:uncharacterized protein TNCV_5026351 [Trichonephila clavipes]|uniref:Uncharacterized protein n=1 Tax=Trichonephila clavipes TaxID=2585209 RepID=A0A8X6RPV9_TRICX|nr:uncharacterized protein TNCV_5026351 [Trichonephila clavipes]